jgi:hypothetical protein
VRPRPRAAAAGGRRPGGRAERGLPRRRRPAPAPSGRRHAADGPEDRDGSAHLGLARRRYRHRTATPTFLTTPKRWRIVLAKLIGYLIVGIPFAAVATAVNLAVLEIYARARGAAPSLDGDNLRVIAGAGTAVVIYAVIGVGVGALLRNQVGAIVAALVYLYVAEPVIAAIGPIQGAYKWLPGGALRAMTTDFGAPDVLQPWQGGLLLLGYGLLAAVLGTLFTVRRDIT